MRVEPIEYNQLTQNANKTTLNNIENGFMLLLYAQFGMLLQQGPQSVVDGGLNVMEFLASRCWWY